MKKNSFSGAISGRRKESTVLNNSPLSRHPLAIIDREIRFPVAANRSRESCEFVEILCRFAESSSFVIVNFVRYRSGLLAMDSLS
ncbi:hypothetical protein TNCV_4453831 [Trichonephila clavipes]|nr:hypothetical protein TNCV_4453831 [Trichonephila clavipes]